MPWALIPLLLPIVLFAVVARRMIRLGLTLRDPEKLRSLFSDGVRTALAEAGYDPDRVSMQEIQGDEELARLVGADLRRALRSSILGLQLPDSRLSPQVDRLRVGDESGRRKHQWSMQAPMRAGQPILPQPIDRSSGPGIRAVLVLVIVGLVAVAIFVASSQP